MLEVGSKVSFKGYSDDTDEEEKVYEAGEILTIKSVEGTGEDVEYNVSNGVTSSVLFPEEVEEHEEDIDDIDLDLDDPDEDEDIDTTITMSVGDTKIDITEALTDTSTVADNVDEMSTDEVFSLSTQDTLKRAKDLVDNINMNYFRLGQVMLSIYDTLMYEELGYEGAGGFKRYCEDELGFNHERIMHCMRIFRNLHANEVSQDDIINMSFTKAIFVARVITESNKDKLLEIAKDKLTTVKELRSFIAENYVEDSDSELEASVEVEGGPRTVKMKFELYEDEAQLAHSILAKADADFDCKGNTSKAFYNILTSFADSIEGVELPLEHDLKAFNARHGLNLTVQDINRAREA